MHFGIEIELQCRLKRVVDQVRKKNADNHSKVDTGNGRDAFARS
jgi:hypothetical protein